MTNAWLMEKYQLSPTQLDDVLNKILKKSRDLAKKIAADVRQGMTDSELMEKYQLSREGLGRAFDRLVKFGLIDKEAFDNSLSSANRQTFFGEKRQVHRRVPQFPVTVVDRANPRNIGQLKDISGRGLGVVGLYALKGEDKSIAILGDDLGVVSPFEVRAECRWVTRASEHTELVSGFQIRQISEKDLAWLREFIETIDLGTLGLLEDTK
jgi:hypothetical protein